MHIEPIDEGIVFTPKAAHLAVPDASRLVFLDALIEWSERAGVELPPALLGCLRHGQAGWLSTARIITGHGPFPGTGDSMTFEPRRTVCRSCRTTLRRLGLDGAALTTYSAMVRGHMHHTDTAPEDAYGDDASAYHDLDEDQAGIIIEIADADAAWSLRVDPHGTRPDGREAWRWTALKVPKGLRPDDLEDHDEAIRSFTGTDLCAPAIGTLGRSTNAPEMLCALLSFLSNDLDQYRYAYTEVGTLADPELSLPEAMVHAMHNSGVTSDDVSMVALFELECFNR